MATFTMYLHEALEAEPGIEAVALTEYPIFNERYRETLNKTIKDHFWNREIGQETPSMFELALRRKMNLIMPVYNKHFITDAIADGVDPLQTMKVNNKSTNTGTSTNTGESDSDSDSTAKSRTVALDYPQNQIDRSKEYASSAQESESATQAKGAARERSETQQQGKSDTEVTGSNGHASMLLFQHRTTFVNVNQMILEDLEELFMYVTSNGDEFSPRGMSLGYGNGYFGYNGHTGFW